MSFDTKIKQTLSKCRLLNFLGSQKSCTEFSQRFEQLITTFLQATLFEKQDVLVKNLMIVLQVYV